MGKARPAYPKGLDFEQVWAAIQAGNERLDRLFEKVARRQEETARQIKATDEKSSKLGGRFGEMIEYKDVKDHVARMEKVRFHADLHGDPREW